MKAFACRLHRKNTTVPVEHAPMMARILIAEDEILIGLSLEATLEQLGHEVLLCSNGKVALAKLEEFKPDLIITDYMMPEMGGDGLIAEIKKRPEVSRTPIILLTSIPEANVSAPQRPLSCQTG